MGFIRFLHRVEDGFLVTSLLTMLLLSLGQIFLRNFFDTGVLWAESFSRMLVLWVAMLGAMVATRESHHIAIDVISRYLPAYAERTMAVATSLFSAVITGLAAWYSYEFVSYEYLDETIAFADVPSWVCAAILPFGFAVISLRFLTNAIRFAFRIEKWDH
ncbi:MAG: TRAP transporter small permease [Pseudomonadales bacterium]|nr:TRAP transporter small permease [Pseudomonadales bacterium]